MRLWRDRLATIASLQFVNEAEVNAGEDETSPVQLGQRLGRHGEFWGAAGERPHFADVVCVGVRY